jgi:hypothetical protein
MAALPWPLEIRALEIRQTDSAALALSGKDDALFRVEAATYQAEIYRDGRVRILSGGEELIRRIVLAQENAREPLVTGDVRKTAADTITIREGQAAPVAGDLLGAAAAERSDRSAAAGGHSRGHHAGQDGLLPCQADRQPAWLCGARARVQLRALPFRASGVARTRWRRQVRRGSLCARTRRSISRRTPRSAAISPAMPASTR